MRADVGGDHGVAVDVKGDPQIPFHYHRINGATKNGRQSVNLMRAQAGIKRVMLEDLPNAADRNPLFPRQFFEVASELRLSHVAISH